MDCQPAALKIKERQLNIRLPADLLDLLRHHAVVINQPVSHLVRRWIEDGLRAAQVSSQTIDPPSSLFARVALLETAVAALKAAQEVNH